MYRHTISAPYFFGKVIDAATKNNMHELNQHVYTCEGASCVGPNLVAGPRFFNLPRVSVPRRPSALAFVWIQSGDPCSHSLHCGVWVPRGAVIAPVAVACIYAMGAVASFFRSWAFTLAGQRLVARVRKILFKSIVSQEVAFFDVTRTGELTNRLASDTQVIQNACTVNLSMLARYFIQILGSIGIMLGVSWKLTLVLLSVVPAVAIGAVAYGRKVKEIRKAFQDRLADASTTAEENIASVRTVKCFSNEPRACSEYDKSVHESQ